MPLGSSVNLATHTPQSWGTLTSGLPSDDLYLDNWEYIVPEIHTRRGEEELTTLVYGCMVEDVTKTVPHPDAYLSHLLTLGNMLSSSSC